MLKWRGPDYTLIFQQNLDEQNNYIKKSEKWCTNYLINKYAQMSLRRAWATFFNTNQSQHEAVLYVLFYYAQQKPTLAFLSN